MESKSLNKTFISKEESSDDEKELMKEGGKLVSKEKKIVSPRSSLNNRETELVVNSLVMKIELLVKKHHKVFNPIAQASLYYLKQKPNGEMLDYLTYLNFTTLNSNCYVLAEAVRIFEMICESKGQIIHEQTVHRLIGCCCLLAGKLHYDNYNPKGFDKILGVRKNKLAMMENEIFIDILQCNLKLLSNKAKK